jgi:DNA-binding transcriptional regulator YiaG
VNLDGKAEQIVWDAKAIKALRKHLGLSQEKLAAALGTRQQTISEWETGMYQPRRSTSRYLSIVAERAGFTYKPEGETGEGQTGKAAGAAQDPKT